MPKVRSGNKALPRLPTDKPANKRDAAAPSTAAEKTAPLAADGGSASAREALRALALDTKAERSEESNAGAEAATLGARLMGAFRGDSGRKVYTAIGLGVAMLGVVKPAAAQVAQVRPVARPTTDKAVQEHADTLGASMDRARLDDAPASEWLVESPRPRARPADLPAFGGPLQARIDSLRTKVDVKPTDADGERGLLTRAKHKLVEVAWDELQDQHDVGASVDIGAGKLSVRIQEKVIRSDAPFVRNDPARRATSERLAAESGESVFWLETGGIMDARAGFAQSVPVGGVAHAYAGFHVEGAVEYRALNPHTAGAGAIAKELWQDHSVEVPVDAARARAMLPGTEVEVTGRGTALVSTGSGVGTSTSVGDVTVAAGARATTTRGRSGKWSVGVTRLQGDDVRVVLSEVQARTRGTSVRADVGVRLDADAATDMMPELGDGGLADLVEKEGASGLQSAVRRYLSVHASASSAKARTTTDVVSYVLDLSTEQGRAAYDRLVRLDEDGAHELAHAAPDAVSRNTYDEVAVSEGETRRVEVLGQKLLLTRALRREAAGTLTADGQTQLIRTSRYSRRSRGLIGGRKDINWEGVRVTDGASGADEHYFHLRFDHKDKYTSRRDVADFVRFADALGAQDADPRDVVPANTNFFSRLFTGKDDTRVHVDVYFSDDGVHRIADASRSDVIRAWLDSASALDAKLGAVPHTDANAVQVIVDAAKVQAELDQHPGGGRDAQDAKRPLRSRMRRLEKRYDELGYDGDRLEGHADAYLAASRFAHRVGEMGADADSAWTRFFADLGQAERFEYMGSITTLARLAGADHTLVHEVSLEGGGVHLRAVDEGRLENPGAAVTRATRGSS